jgi:hypothetical protein
VAEARGTGLDGLRALVGEWTTEATHPAIPGLKVHGHAVFEWLAGEKFLIVRAQSDHRDFPNSISIIGDTALDRIEAGTNERSEDLRMHYFDERGVHRVYDLSIGVDDWQLSRDAPGFSQRFTGRFEDGGDKIVGLWKLSTHDAIWDDDLAITYRRRRAD